MNTEEYFENSLRRDLHLKGPNLPDVERVFFEEPLIGEEYAPFELFVGCEEELDKLSFSLSQAMRGLYKKIILEGKSGSGKTSMLHLVGKIVTKIHPNCITIYYSKKDYLRSFEEIRFDALDAILDTYISGKTRDEKFAKERKAMTEFSKQYMRTRFFDSKEEPSSIKDVFQKHGLCTEKEDPLQKYYKKLKNKRFLFLIDNAENLLEKKEVLTELNNLIEQLSGITLFAFFPQTVSGLKEKKEELVKNCQTVRLEQFTEKQCKEILRRRLLFGKKELDKVKEEPNYTTALQPFAEETVAKIARIAGYNPLKFIQKLKLAVLCARENNYEIIDEKCLIGLLENEETNMAKLIQLTHRQQIVFDFVRANGPVTVEQVRKKMQLRSRVGPFLMLNRLVEKKMIVKERKGKIVIFKVPGEGT